MSESSRGARQPWWGRFAVRGVLAVVLAGVVGAPLAVSWALTHMQVVTRIGTSPTTLTLTTQGHSELRLGLAGGLSVPRSRGPVGIVATVEGPGDPGTGDGDIAAYVRPEVLSLYTGLFSDPGAAVEEYVRLMGQQFRHEVVVAELVVALGGGGLLLVMAWVVPPRERVRRVGLRFALAVAVVMATTTGVAWGQLQSGGLAQDGAASAAGEVSYALPILDGTLAEGATTNSPVIRAVLGGAVDKARHILGRQQASEVAYRARAEEDLGIQRGLMQGPREGELAVLMQSDMHCIGTMIDLQGEVVSMLREDHGDDALSLLAITGDLTTNGTAAEGTCIRREAAIMDPVAAISGNHESDLSEGQMTDAGMAVLDGEAEEVGGITVLGDGDPSRSELLGATALRGEETQRDQGRRLFEQADEGDRPDLVLVHEAYAAAAFLDVGDARAMLTPDDDPTAGATQEPTTGPAVPLTERVAAADDGVRDLPTSAIFYGHWHRDVAPRVLWNSDGTWTLLMELDTSGGAVGSPTLTNFSTPWTQPQQEAAFPVVFLDEETRLVTGYQLYRFDTGGRATVEPRVEVGDLGSRTSGE